MQLQLIRNATLKLTYCDFTILIDPFFADKHSLPSFANNSPNPLIDLPLTIDEIIDGIDAILVSHLHSDHFDDMAQQSLPKDMLLYCQPEDAATIQEKGFSQVVPIEDLMNTPAHFTIKRRSGRHGQGDVRKMMGTVSSFLFTDENEKTLFWAGDTVWYDNLANDVKAFSPDAIVTHSSGAYWQGDGPIVMDAEQTIAVCKAHPNATVIATHMDSLDHGTVSREDLRSAATEAGISEDQLLIPADGDSLDI